MHELSMSAELWERLPALQMVALGALVLGAYLGGRLCRSLGVTEVIGQLLGGALVGPYVLSATGVFPEFSMLYRGAVGTLEFFTFVLLSLIAFGIGEELHWRRVRAVGRSAVVICLVHLVTTFGLSTLAFGFLAPRWLEGFSWLDAMLIGSIAMTSAPAVTFALLNELRVEGRLRQMTGNIIVLADLVGVLAFSVISQILLARMTPDADFSPLGRVATDVGMASLLGAGIFVLLLGLVRRRAQPARQQQDEQRPEDINFFQRLFAEHPSPSVEIFLVVFGAVSLGAGIAYLFHWPFLVTTILAGFLVANWHSHAIFDSLKINDFSSILNLGFFALIGASISLESFSLESLWLVLMYVLTRFVGKQAGLWLGCRLMREDPKITACLPSLLQPQTGVAAVEAVYVSMLLGRPEFAAIILPGIVVFGVGGVFQVEYVLRRWRSWLADEARAMARPALEGLAESARRLLDHLASPGIVLDVRGRTKQQVIREMLDAAAQDPDVHFDVEQAMQQLMEREDLAPTGHGQGVAIPHCRLMGLERPLVVLGRHANAGVVFGGIDERPCDLFVLILSSAREPAAHLKLLGAAAHVLKDAGCRARWRRAGRPEELRLMFDDLVIAHG